MTGWPAYVLALEAHLAGREGGDRWADFARRRDAYAAALG